MPGTSKRSRVWTSRHPIPVEDDRSRDLGVGHQQIRPQGGGKGRRRWSVGAVKIAISLSASMEWGRGGGRSRRGRRDRRAELLYGFPPSSQLHLSLGRAFQGETDTLNGKTALMRASRSCLVIPEVMP